MEHEWRRTRELVHYAGGAVRWSDVETCTRCGAVRRDRTIRGKAAAKISGECLGSAGRPIGRSRAA